MSENRNDQHDQKESNKDANKEGKSAPHRDSSPSGHSKSSELKKDDDQKKKNEEIKKQVKSPTGENR